QLVTVVAPPPPPPPPSSGVAFVRTSPPAVSFYERGELAVSAVAVDSSSRILGTAVTWRSSDTTVVTLALRYTDVPQIATLYGVRPGTSTISATAGSVTGTTAVTIVPLPPLPLDTAVALLVGGFVVTNAPIPWRTTFPARTIWS